MPASKAMASVNVQDQYELYQQITQYPHTNPCQKHEPPYAYVSLPDVELTPPSNYYYTDRTEPRLSCGSSNTKSHISASSLENPRFILSVVHSLGESNFIDPTSAASNDRQAVSMSSPRFQIPDTIDYHSPQHEGFKTIL